MLAAKAEKMQRIEELREVERLRQLQLMKKENKKASLLRHDRAWVCSLVMLCFVMAICFTSLEAKITTCDYKINDLKSQINEQENKNDRMSLEIEDLKSLTRVESYAMANLDMAYPQNTNISYMKFSGIAVADNSVDNHNAATVQATGNGTAATVTVRKDVAVHPLLITLDKLLSKYFSGNEAVAKES